MFKSCKVGRAREEFWIRDTSNLALENFKSEKVIIGTTGMHLSMDVLRIRNVTHIDYNTHPLLKKPAFYGPRSSVWYNR